MANGERTLTERELNRAILARQLLLERVRMPIARAVERDRERSRASSVPAREGGAGEQGRAGALGRDVPERER